MQKKFDFTSLGKIGAKKEKVPTDPIQIFERRPSIEGGFDDLWRGQAEALEDWNKNHRNTDDTLITLNTGAGKTVVGLLIAQSLVNEGVENVV
jgi:superfamily II DNA or RNA helicase